MKQTRIIKQPSYGAAVTPVLLQEKNSFQRPALYVSRLHLTDFRSYRGLTVESGGRSVVLTGANGAGKTNILEALSFLSSGRGLRSCKLSDATRLGGPVEGGQKWPKKWAVAARLQTPDGTTTLGTGLADTDPAEARDRRQVRIDGENSSSPAAFDDILQVAWLTPQMDRLFIDAPSGRRKFLDRIVANFHSPHMREVNAYERVMRERNRLLADGTGDPAWLEALEGRMAEHGVAVAAARLEAVERLTSALAESISGAGTASSFPRAILAVDGTLEQGLMAGPALAVEEDFRARLRDNRIQDSRSGRTGVGPHKTDLLVTHALKNIPAALCSTGEQKALLIGITLASARITAASFGAAPLLLLDEVVAHLDHMRRKALFDELAALRAQVWLTGTDKLLFAGLRGEVRHFRVENNNIYEENKG